MIIAVLDTNVLASGFVRPGPTPGQLLGAWRRGAYTLAVSEHIIAELTRTLGKTYFRRYIAEQQAAAIITLVRTEALVAPIPDEIHGVATHSEDDVILATAISAGAEHLVTGDTKLLQLGSFRGVAIVSARAFLDLLTE